MLAPPAIQARRRRPATPASVSGCPSRKPRPNARDRSCGRNWHGCSAALARAGRPTLRWELPAVSADALGQLLLALELQTAFQAALYGVNAYDQPGVEAGKVAAFALIGREGYATERAAIRRERPPSWKV